MFSPAEVHVYDRLGNHTGVVDTQNEIFEEKIPNSYYFEVGESKYLGVDVEDVSRVELKGTGLGTFTLEIEQVVGTTSTTTTYADVPVSPSMKGVIDVTKSTPQLNLDIEGDGKADFIVGPAVHLDPLIYAQMLQKIVKGMKLYSSVEDSILDKLKDILSEIKDKDFDDAREVRNEVRRILLNLEWKEGKITQVQRKSLLLLFNVFNIGKDDNIASVIYVEQWVTDIKSRNLEDGVEGSILAKIDDVYDELVEEDNKEAKEDLEKLIKNLLDQSWKSGKIAQDQRDLLISNAVELQASLKSIQS
jgi:hypothetical protein